jgi:purine-binding chemotaxis protein CheW
MKRRSLCTFRVNNLTVGVDVTRVQEVLRSRPVTPVPLSELAVSGLLNLRGQIVTVVDMRARLGFDASESKPSGAVHIVVKSRGELLGLVADCEGDVVDIDEDTIQDLSEIVDDAIDTCFVGKSNVDDCLLFVLEPDRVLSGFAP